MYKCVSNITIIQQPSVAFPQRTKTIIFNFATDYECIDTWRNLTNTGKITIPKNLYARDINNKLIPLFGTTENIGGFSSNAPLFMRGDKVIIDNGYKFYKNNVEIFQGTENTKSNTHLFTGWISQVTSKKPIELLIENDMWKLKQIPVNVHTFSGTDTLEKIMTTLLIGTPYKVNSTTTTTFGTFRVGNESVAEVLSRLRKQYHFEAYFRDSILYCGSLVYSPLIPKQFTFTFQQNIISDELEYRRKDDIVLSAIVSNTIEEGTGKITRDGKAKTKKVRLEVLVTFKSGSDTPIIFPITKNNPAPENTGGERRSLFFPGANTITELANLGAAELKKYYYTGFKGKFTTFGLPYVRMGDNVQLIDTILPERNGLYKVRGVEYKGGKNGNRQIIELDFKILL